VVVDEQNNVIHTQIATGLADELDCEAIITLLKPTVSVSSNILNTPTQLKDRRESFRINTLIVAPPPCYCKIELVAPKEDATATYKRAYALATDTIYEKLKQQRKNAANLIVKDVGASNIMQLNLRDISSSGCSMFNHDEAFSYFLVPNTIYKDCSIHVLDYDEVKVSFRIVLKHRIGNYNLGGFNEIIGVEFINMTQAIESTISYYVREIERRQISLFNEETGT
jgi:hypothetical protein